MMICAEWWAFEVLIVLGGVIGVDALASIIIVMSICALIFMVPLGIQEATCGIIGNCIGANNVPLAKRFFSIITKFTLASIIVIGTVIFLARKNIVSLFTKDETIIDMTEKVLILVACMLLTDGMQGYLSGPIRALGLQQKASYVAIACHWLVAIPLAAALGIWQEMGPMGLMAGEAIAVTF